MAATAKKTPRKKNAIKAAKRSLKNRARNESFKIRMKTAMKKFVKGLAAGKAPEATELSTLYKFIDKCAKVGVISKQSAGRKKSIMAKKVTAPVVAPVKKVAKAPKKVVAPKKKTTKK